MEKMKSLADQLREKMIKPGDRSTGDPPKRVKKNVTAPKKKERRNIDSTILKALLEYDNSDHKTMVHFRFDKQTVDFLNQFKIATGVDTTKFVALAVRHFIETYPELKTIIKQFIQNSYL